MNSGSVVYQKGDLISLKQNSLVLYWLGLQGNKKFETINKPTMAIFLGFCQELEINNYLSGYTPIKNACKIAIDNKVAYIDGSQFHFYNKRRNYEKVN